MSGTFFAIYVIKRGDEGFSCLATYHDFEGLSHLLNGCSDCFIKLDLANYKITDSTCAIGIRYGHPVEGGTNLYSEILELYVIKDKSLMKILDDGVGFLSRWGESKSVLIFLKTKTNGYYDILKKSTFSNHAGEEVEVEKEYYRWHKEYQKYCR